MRKMFGFNCNNHSGLVPSTFLTFLDVFKGSREPGQRETIPQIHRDIGNLTARAYLNVSQHEQDTRKRVSVVDMLLDEPHAAYVPHTRSTVATDKFMLATVSSQTLSLAP